MFRTAEREIDVVSRRIGMYARGDTGISSNSKKSSQNTLQVSVKKLSMLYSLGP